MLHFDHSFFQLVVVGFFNLFVKRSRRAYQLDIVVNREVFYFFQHHVSFHVIYVIGIGVGSSRLVHPQNLHLIKQQLGVILAQGLNHVQNAPYEDLFTCGIDNTLKTAALLFIAFELLYVGGEIVLDLFGDVSLHVVQRVLVDAVIGLEIVNPSFFEKQEIVLGTPQAIVILQKYLRLLFMVLVPTHLGRRI